MIATAAGSFPGVDFRAVLELHLEVFPEVLPLPELPARNVGAGMIGRAVALAEGLSFDLQPAGWRLTTGSDANYRRARSQWRRDLDDLEELARGFEGILKVAVCGPWTLAASVEKPRGDRALADHGARRELAQALLLGVENLTGELERRLPGAKVEFQIDEPALPAVVAGQIPTASGFSKHRRVSVGEATAVLKPYAAFPETSLHCCAEGSWLVLAARAGFQKVYVDTRWFRSSEQLDELARWLNEDRKLLAGVVATSSPRLQSRSEISNEARRVLRPSGLEFDQLKDAVWVAPACGLAGWDFSMARAQCQELLSSISIVEELLAESG